MNFVKNFMIFSKKEKIFKLYHGKPSAWSD